VACKINKKPNYVSAGLGQPGAPGDWRCRGLLGSCELAASKERAKDSELPMNVTAVFINNDSNSSNALLTFQRHRDFTLKFTPIATGSWVLKMMCPGCFELESHFPRNRPSQTIFSSFVSHCSLSCHGFCKFKPL